MNNLSKIVGRKKWGFSEGSATSTSRESKSNSRSACKKIDTKKPNLASEIKVIGGLGRV